MAELFKIWSITSYDEYLKEWPSITGPFNQLTDYQKSLGYKTPQEFFEKQSFAAQTLANDRVGNILDRIFQTKDLTPAVRNQLKKFTYQTIDFLRINDSIVNFDIRSSQISFNNNRQFTTELNIDRIEQLCGPMAWRSWLLANIERLYASWAQANDIPYLLDEKRFYNKEEIDYELSKIDDQIQTQQKLVDQKLKEFNDYMVQYLNELPNNVDFIDKVVTEAAKNPKLKGEKGDKGAQLEKILVDNVDETKARIIETLDDGTSILSNEFELPRGPQGPEGPQGPKGENGDSSDLPIDKTQMPNGDRFAVYKDKQDADSWKKVSDNALISKNYLKENPVTGGLVIQGGLEDDQPVFQIDKASGQTTWFNNYGESGITKIMQSYPQTSGNVTFYDTKEKALLELDRGNSTAKYKGHEIATLQDLLSWKNVVPDAMTRFSLDFIINDTNTISFYNGNIKLEGTFYHLSWIYKYNSPNVKLWVPIEGGVIDFEVKTNNVNGTIYMTLQHSSQKLSFENKTDHLIFMQKLQG